MKLLLDTHAAIWWINGHDGLSPETKAMLEDDTNFVYVSIVSAWEIAIKTSCRKLPEFMGGSMAFLRWLDGIPVTLLPIAPRHVEVVETLPFIHRDPFDRLLVAVAKADGMTILTADENIRKYDVDSAW